MNDSRTNRLLQARKEFHCQNNTASPLPSNPAPMRLTYMQGYMLRCIIVIFLLALLGFYGIANTTQWKKLKTWTTSQVGTNVFVEDAYQTYSQLDYSQMIHELATLLEK